MGGFVCTHCGETSHIFGDEARDWARAKSVAFLGSVPLEKEIMVSIKNSLLRDSSCSTAVEPTPGDREMVGSNPGLFFSYLSHQWWVLYSGTPWRCNTTQFFYYIDTKLKIILAAQLEANLAAYARFEPQTRGISED